MSDFFVPPAFDDSDSPSPEFSKDLDASDGKSIIEPETEFYKQQSFEDANPLSKLNKADLSQFNSSDFMEEGTLLTNIEDYAKKIRNSADRYASRIRRDAELFKSENELELANALLIRKEAEEDAHELLANSKVKHDEAV